MADLNLYRKHFTSIDSINKRQISALFGWADALRKDEIPHGKLTGKSLACLFYEPSTRTSSSFIAAAHLLGGTVIPITQGVQFSSVAKGETLEDTIVTLGQYADAIVLRHPEIGSADRAAAVSPVPIINAGDGAGEHPTQALLDLYTIRAEIGRTDNFHIAFVGDLRFGRTVHSLIHLLLNYPNVTISLISPHRLSIEKDSYTGKKLVAAANEGRTIGEHFVTKSVTDGTASFILADADIVYVTRVQKERFLGDAGRLTYDDIKDSCLLTPEVVEKMKPSARILHPLPRVNEIPTSIDADPRAAYFRQVRNGMYVRAALLNAIIKGIEVDSWASKS